VKGFAAEVMSAIEIHADVTVISPGHKPGGYGVATDGEPQGHVQRDGWPELATYNLGPSRIEASFPVVEGTASVYALRSVEDNMAAGNWFPPILNNEGRQCILAEALRVSPESFTWQLRPQKTIEYQSKSPYLKSLRNFLEDEISKQRATAQALADQGLMDPSEISKAMPQIIVDVTDWRESGPTLPEDQPSLPNVEIRVRHETVR
jgi:hypothetical protein